MEIIKKLRIEGLLFFLPLIAGAQNGGKHYQRASQTACSNVVALAGDVKLNCSSLTSEQQRIIDGLPAILRKIVSNSLPTDAVIKKLDELALSVQQLRLNPPDPDRGLLVPANDPNPEPTTDWCKNGIPAEWFRLYLGSFMIASPGFPTGGIALGGKEVVGFREHDGKIGVSATVSSPDGKRIAFIKDGYFKLDDYFRKESPDPSTLNVFNETEDQPVLHVRFLNPKSILVTGQFNEGGLAATITSKSIIFSGGTSSGGCSKSTYGGEAYVIGR